MKTKEYYTKATINECLVQYGCCLKTFYIESTKLKFEAIWINMSIEDDNLSTTHDKSEIKNPSESLEAKKDKSFLITAKISKHFKKYLGNKKAESWLIEKIRKGTKQ